MPNFTSNNLDPAVVATNTTVGDGIRAVSTGGVAVRAQVTQAGAIAVDAHGEEGTIALVASSVHQAAMFASSTPGIATVDISGAPLSLRASGTALFVATDPSNPAVDVQAQGNVGIRAVSSSNVAVSGESAMRAGISGSTNSASESAVFGINNAKGQIPDGLNRPAGNGVWGHTTVEKGAGVVGSVDGNLSEAAGVVGIGPNAGRFFGNVEVTGSLKVDHDIQLTGDLFLSNTGKDLAEQFQVDPTAQCEPGMLMAIGRNGALVPCASSYDKRVIGVISGAGMLRPAITLGQADGFAPTAAIALVGTVFCRVDADKASIEVGDLLTSSETPGHAMKAQDPMQSFGAVIGKALAPLRTGRGLLPIVIALQ